MQCMNEVFSQKELQKSRTSLPKWGLILKPGLAVIKKKVKLFWSFEYCLPPFHIGLKSLGWIRWVFIPNSNYKVQFFSKFHPPHQKQSETPMMMGWPLRNFSKSSDFVDKSFIFTCDPILYKFATHYSQAAKFASLDCMRRAKLFDT